MSKEENVLVIDRLNIPNKWLGEKIAKKVNVSELEPLMPFIKWKERALAENDESVKQMIPYLIVESDIDRKVAIYQRKGSEKRIHGLFSVGIGGHVNPIDFEQGDSFLKFILRSAKRELLEEFSEIAPKDKFEFLGIINEEKTKVGRTHLGLVFKLKINGRAVADKELFNLNWEYKKKIKNEYNLEMWSEMALDLDIDIKDFFENLNLTLDQDKVIDKLEEFFFSDKQVFILKGYAGTGKTTVLKGISKYLQKNNRLGHIMAPTGRAAKVIQNKTKYPASTIHKFLYDLENLKTYKYTDKDGNETFKFYFDFPADDLVINTVYIFDESSMISNNFSEGEFFRFGSGYLLNDILKFFNLNNTLNTKLIFVGDPAQLPPVGSSRSLALEESFFKNKGFSVNSIEMTQVVRQKENSGILINANYYRNLIFSEIVSENFLKTEFDDIKEINVENVATTFTGISPLPDSKKSIVITFSNKLALDYNKMIREQYFPDEKNIVAGDILQVIRNNYSNQQFTLLNGDFVKVLSVSDEIISQSASIKKKNANDVLITHYFRKIELLHYSGNVAEMMIIDSFLNGKERGLTSDETKALYINFIMRYEKRIGGKANKRSEEFKNAFRSDPFYNALQVKYGYAITGHKSQGGEWENVFVDFTGKVGTSKDVLRWSYTAITRATENLFVLYPPKLKQVDFSKVKHVIIGKIKKAPKGAILFPNIPPTPFHDANSHPAKRYKYFELKEAFNKLGYAIKSVISNEYQERYTIVNDQTVFTLEMYHDKEGIFKNFSIVKKNKDDDEVIKTLKTIQPWPYQFLYTTNDDLSNKIYQSVLSAMQGLNIQIINIDDSRKLDFHVDYYFRTEAQIAYLQIYFNKKEMVTGVIAKSMLGKEDQVLHDLINNLKNT